MYIRSKKAKMDDGKSCCYLHIVELIDVVRKSGSAALRSQYSKPKLALLQCLHDKKRMWYRSRVTDLMMLGLTIDNEDLEFVLEPEGRKSSSFEIFATLNCTYS